MAKHSSDLLRGRRGHAATLNSLNGLPLARCGKLRPFVRGGRQDWPQGQHDCLRSLAWFLRYLRWDSVGNNRTVEFARPFGEIVV